MTVPRSLFRLSITLLVAAIALAALRIVLAQTRATAERDVSSRLMIHARLRSTNVAGRLDKLRQETIFLSELPPIQGIVRAHGNGGIDPLEHSSEQMWRNRLEAIFLAFSRTHPEITRVRLVVAGSCNQEIVRVDCSGPRCAVVSKDSTPCMGERPFLKEALARGNREVYFSEISPNLEMDAFGSPRIPTLRSTIPIHRQDGRLFGALLVNTDARPLLRDLQTATPSPFQAYLTDQNGLFLSLPAAPAAHAAARHWNETFAPHRPLDTTSFWIRKKASTGSLLVAQRRVPVDASGRRSWTVSIAYPDTAMRTKISESRTTVFLAVSVSCGVLGLLVYLYFLGERRKQRQLERLVHERTSQIEALLESAGSAIVATDVDGKTVLFNPAAERLLGLKVTDVLGRRLPQGLLDPEELAAWRLAHPASDVPGLASLMADPNSKRPENREWTLVRQDGTRVPVLLTLSAIDGTGQTASHLVVALDLTERRKVEKELRQRTEEAQAATRSKAEFLANMSHEIRTPMNAVMGLAYLLERRALPAESAELVRKITRAGASLQALLDDILDVSKIEAGRLEIEHIPFLLDEVLDNLATIMGANSGAKEIELAIAPPPSGARRLVGDPRRLGQILINLTGNAIKFTEHGSVRVDIDVVEIGSEEALLRFSVCDTGIGIPQERLQSIFTPFTQADSSTTRRFGGTGLGLTICSFLVEKMGGAIGVESEPGKGSCFHFTARFGIAPEEEAAEDPFLNADILVVDDSAFSREAIAAVASSIGWAPTMVSSGEEAVQEATRRKDGNESLDVVLLDWKMPGMDGLDTARELRSLLDRETPPIVLLATAHALEELESLPEARLADGFLAKPVTGSSLFNAVQDARRRRGDEVEHLPVPHNARRVLGLRVLVVDDNDTNREVVVAILEDEGAWVHTESGGQAALDWLSNNPAAVDIVLMDIQMPEMDGFAATRALRANPALAELPVVALSAGVLESERAAAKEAGMDDFVPKPFRASVLVQVLCRLTGRPAPEAEAPPPSASASPVLDLATGLSLWKDEGKLRERLARFPKEHGEEAEQIGRLLQAGDAEQAGFLLHRLKGVAGAIGLLHLVAAASRLESHLASATANENAVEDLKVQMHEAVDAILRLLPPQEESSLPPPVFEVPSREAAAESLSRIREALASDERRKCLEALKRAEGMIELALLEKLRDHVENFDFRAAEALLQNYAHEHGSGLKEA